MDEALVCKSDTDFVEGGGAGIVPKVAHCSTQREKTMFDHMMSTVGRLQTAIRLISVRFWW